MRLVLALMAASALAAAAVSAPAATAKKAPAASLRAGPGWGDKPDRLVPHDNWDGVWQPVENNMFDNSRGRVNPNEGREYPPYKPEWEAKYVAALAETKAGRSTDPTASCLPGGMPRIMDTPRAHELIVKPKQVTLIKETQTIVRRIYVGRKMPEGDDAPHVTFNGFSVGHWEGDTLVVDTKYLRADTVFDRSLAPHSDQMTLHERMRLRTKDLWEDIITVTDPVAFTAPWVVTRTYTRQPTWDILEYACEDNNRNAPGANGVNTVLPPTK